MARADLLCELIKNGLIGDSVNFRKAAEAIDLHPENEANCL